MTQENVLKIMPLIAFFSLIAIIYFTFALIQFGVTNDYMFYNMQEISEDLTDNGVVLNTTADLTLSMFENYREIPKHLDSLFLGIYILFVFSTLIYSYYTQELNHVGMFGYLFFGIMVFLFIVGVVDTLTTWWQTEILDTILPFTLYSTPIFNYYISHIGMFSLIHCLLCLFANKIDLDFSKGILRKEKEREAIDNEVL